ncbi:glycoside hydrolase family 15 protein [Pedobacter jeongneungensis]|uniref:glycoside hydrolase family 15 protein n=1 Tax=Pedobacter jeongneungensis TaxID=947309 RepID=UPI0004691BF7|nr:glycoside hydrolase family 15 protein [Pedobacter jeongneungensis]
MLKQPAIADLGVISDRHGCALVAKDATIHWYTPKRFDAPAVISSLLDAEKGGFWQVNADNLIFLDRQYQDRSSILRTYYAMGGKGLTITDLMPLGTLSKGILRLFSPVPSTLYNTLKLRGDYGLEEQECQQLGNTKLFFPSLDLYLHCSHALSVNGELISFEIEAGADGWAYLTDTNTFDQNQIADLLRVTLNNWAKVESLVDYHGPYENQVRYSLRALQQMVYEPTGGIIAAATTSLPEEIGGERNYDYRYVWMRDAALITSSLTQIITTGELEEKFLAFIAGAMKKNGQQHVSCFYSIDQNTVSPTIRELDLSGYLESRPVQIGNSAAEQFQLDAEANILITCSLIYQKSGKVSHWDVVGGIADFICKHWENKDNGIWEEEQQQHYTSSKAFAARGLELIAPYQKDKAIAERWLANAAMIRNYINENCITAKGAYAVHAGSQDVDLTAALYVPFGFDKPDSLAMKSTILEIEKGYAEGELYRRHLLEFDSSREGVFLAGSCWMAHYYALAGNLPKSKSILDAVLALSNDLGFLSEEANTITGELLGNFPQTFVHSSLICAVNGYKLALNGKESIVKL